MRKQSGKGDRIPLGLDLFLNLFVFLFIIEEN